MKYAVVLSDPADADRDRFYYAHLLRDPDYAQKWYVRLAEALADLTEFPLSHAIDEDASNFYGREVRRLLYYGPTRRRSGVPVRILFTVFPPAPDDPPETAEAVILLLRLLHGRQVLDPEDPTEG